MASEVQLIDTTLIEATLERARASARLRTNHNFHATPAANPHRFLNAWVWGSYAAPHRHLAAPKPESFLVLVGKMAVFLFDDCGEVTAHYVLGENGVLGIDLAPGIWHTVAPITETAVCFEVKPGPYDPATDKEFAPWAPLEGDPAAGRYLENLMARASLISRA